MRVLPCFTHLLSPKVEAALAKNLVKSSLAGVFSNLIHGGRPREKLLWQSIKTAKVVSAQSA